MAAGVEVREEPIRLALRLEASVLYAALDASAARDDVLARDEEGAVVGLGPFARMTIPIAPAWIAAEVGVPVMLAGIEARAAGNPLLALRDLVVVVRLAIGVELDLR